MLSNGKNPLFDASLIRRIIQNPVYCGKIAYGRRKTEKIEGTRNEFHIVKQNEFSVYDGKAMKIDDYVAKRSKLIDYTSIIDLDMEFDHLEYYQKIVSTLDLNAYLPDGMTLLISTIKCNDPEKIEERDATDDDVDPVALTENSAKEVADIMKSRLETYNVSSYDLKTVGNDIITVTFSAESNLTFESP